MILMTMLLTVFTSTPAPAAACFAGTPRPFWFEVRSERSTTYLLGTVHLGIAMAQLPVEVRQIIAASDDLAVEALPPTWLDHLRSWVTSWRRPPAVPLRRRLPPDLWDTLVARLRANEVSEAYDETLTVDAAILFADRHFKDLGAWTECGQLDEEIRQSFRDRGARVRGLESDRTQENLIAKLFSMERLIFELKRSAADYAADPDPVAAYARGDEKALLAMLAAGLPNEDLAREVLIDRNRAWVPRIEAMHRRPGRHLVAVGAAHLLGRDGLVAQLRARGWRVARPEAVGD